MRSISAGLLLAALGGMAFAALAGPPHRVTLHYDVSRNGTPMVEVTETLEHDGSRYRIDSKWKGKGLFAMVRAGSAMRSSEGALDGAGLRPLEFRDRRGDGPLGIVRFDWARHLLVREGEGGVQTQPLPEGSQDRLSFAWGFAFAPPARREVEAAIADARGISRQRYRVAGNETLNTPAGNFEALRLVKRREGGDTRATEIWLATKLSHLPLRILVIEKDGTRIDQVVTRIGG